MVLNGPRVDRAQLINPETRSGNVGCRPLYDNAVNARDYGKCKTKHTGLKEAEDATTRADVAVMSGLIVMDLHRPRRPVSFRLIWSQPRELTVTDGIHLHLGTPCRVSLT
ncbi:hypothetical protein AnigIFM50267_009324 [Aspergillus niger]|nr:hypothetical protein AnigIFM50267_009324 [Aspergillus niger]